MGESDSQPLPVRHHVVDLTSLPERTGVVAFLSAQVRNGPWRLAPATRIVAVLGSVELDLREVELGDGESTIEVFSLLGSVEIIVPPGVRVLNEGDSLAGNFTLQPGDWTSDASQPVIRITGTAYLADVDVRQQAYGETNRQARRRRRSNRR